MIVKAKNGQTLLDVAISYGSIEDVFALAIDNNISITDNISNNQIKYDNYEENKNVEPATYPTTEQIEVLLYGIGSLQYVESNPLVDYDNNEDVSNIINVLSGQNTLDIALQYFGSAAAAFDIAIENNISITDDIALHKLHPVVVHDKEVVREYKNLSPATYITTQQYAELLPIEQEGVEFWAIEIDFEVS